ncbi:MAG: FeoB-associated Cys-rich membrane protein [Fusobacteriaceae bacterium]|nr:FeoB-associated Cys-rich membrane protein [Fusobacteriaceae bacterium]
MKTVIILLILAFPVYHSLRKLVRVFTKKERGCSCSSCPSGIKSSCHSKK